MHILYCIVLYCTMHIVLYFCSVSDGRYRAKHRIRESNFTSFIIVIYIYVSVLSRTSSNAITYFIKTLDIFGHLIFYTGIANKFLYLSLFIREKGDNKTYFRW